jgi:isopenicillin N synthase-like dioxygenase
MNPPPGALVCNVGDMLQRLTNHLLPSTTHRVVNPPQRARASRATRCPSSCTSTRTSRSTRCRLRGYAGRPECLSRADHADDYLQQRLREIRLL